MAKYKGTDVWEIIDNVQFWSGQKTLEHSQAEMAIQTKNAEIMSTAVRHFKEATEEGARKMNNLTIATVVLTAVLVGVGGIQLYLYFSN